MITMKHWMELVDYKVTEGSAFGWDCYGSNSYTLDSWNGVDGTGGYSSSIVFSIKTQKVYEVTVCDYTNGRAYRMINRNNQAKHRAEALACNVDFNQAWDKVEWTDLETDQDFIEKARAIVAGQPYDTRVSVPLEFSDHELLKYMKLAHESDITFNQFVEQVLVSAIETLKNERQI